LVFFRHTYEAKLFQIGLIDNKILYGWPENVLISTEPFTWWAKEILPANYRDQTQPLDLAFLHIEKTENTENQTLDTIRSAKAPDCQGTERFPEGRSSQSCHKRILTIRHPNMLRCSTSSVDHPRGQICCRRSPSLGKHQVSLAG
jgi:hypothetical protein